MALIRSIVRRYSTDPNQFFRIAKTGEEINSIREEWTSLNPPPFADIDSFKIPLSSGREFVNPFVILLSRAGYAKAMLVARIEKMRFDIKLGDRLIYGPKIISLTIAENGIFGDINYETCSALIYKLLKSLKECRADIVSFGYVNVNSDIYKIVNGIKNPLYHDFFPILDFRHRICLPDTYDEFIKGRKNKRRLTRLWNKLLKAHKNDACVIKYIGPEHINKLWNDVVHISKNAYQFVADESLEKDHEMNQLIKIFAKKGLLKAWVLYVANIPCAFYWGVKSNNKLILMHTGYNAEYRKYEVGTICMLKMIEDSCNDSGIDFIDFGVHSSQYKQRFCNNIIEEAKLYIFRPSLKGLLLNSMRIIAGTLQQFKKIITIF